MWNVLVTKINGTVIQELRCWLWIWSGTCVGCHISYCSTSVWTPPVKCHYIYWKSAALENQTTNSNLLQFQSFIKPTSIITPLLLSYPVLCLACQPWTPRQAVVWESWPSLITCGQPSLLSSLVSCWLSSFTQGPALKKTVTIHIQGLLWPPLMLCWTSSG